MKEKLIRLNAKVLAGLRNEDFDRMVDWAIAQDANKEISQVQRVENVVRLFDKQWGNRLAEIKHSVATMAFAYARLTGKISRD